MQQVGLAKVLETVKKLHAEHGVYWEVAPLLEKRAEAGTWE